MVHAKYIRVFFLMLFYFCLNAVKWKLQISGKFGDDLVYSKWQSCKIYENEMYKTRPIAVVISS